MSRIAFRLDAGGSIGSGHLVRCASLAGRLRDEYGAEVVFVCRDRLGTDIGFEVAYLGAGYAADVDGYRFPTICDELDRMDRFLREWRVDCLVVDHYGAGDDYFRGLRGSVPFLACIDDGMGRDIPADLVLNGNAHGARADYGSVPVQLLGCGYALLRSEFADVPERTYEAEMRRVYVTSGGADPLRFCECVARAVMAAGVGLELHVIAGPDFGPGYVAGLEELGVTIHENVDMRECMLAADLFISGAGSTLYELAATGTPSVSYVLADDQRLVAEAMWAAGCSMAGGAFSGFDAQGLLAILRKVCEADVRREMGKKGQGMIDGSGTTHAAGRIAAALGDGGEREKDANKKTRRQDGQTGSGGGVLKG